MVFGYIRVSTNKQETESQKLGIVKKAKELETPIDEWIADEGVSGAKEYSKRNLGLLMEKLKDGDVLIVSEISRLARSVFMLFRIVEYCIQTKDCTIYAIKEGHIFRKNDVVSTIILSAYGTAAQIEREMNIKRTMEGIERRRMDGVIFGRPVGAKSKPKLAKKHKELMAYIEQGLSKNKIAKKLQCTKTTLLKYMKDENINYESRFNSNIYKLSSNYDTYVKNQKTLNKQKNYILGLINKGLNTTLIREKLKEKGFAVSYSAVQAWISKNPKIYECATRKNQELRAAHNKDCGKFKRYYSAQCSNLPSSTQ
jgi:DNA invertase Pin-like site-specific DNA recombinase